MVTTSSKGERADTFDSREGASPTRVSMISGKVLTPPVPHVIDHPIARHALTLIRSKHTPGRLLQAFSNQLLLLLSMEATRSVPVREEPIDTESGAYVGSMLAKPVAFISLARHGIGLTHHIADYIPNVAIGSISLEHSQNGQRLEPRLHLPHAPALHDTRVILFDPIIGTGITAGVALNLLTRSGAVDLALISFVISAAGVKRVQASTPKLGIWTAAIDEELDLKRGPIPGVGDFANRLYA